MFTRASLPARAWGGSGGHPEIYLFSGRAPQPRPGRRTLAGISDKPQGFISLTGKPPERGSPTERHPGLQPRSRPVGTINDLGSRPESQGEMGWYVAVIHGSNIGKRYFSGSYFQKGKKKGINEYVLDAGDGVLQRGFLQITRGGDHCYSHFTEIQGQGGVGPDVTHGGQRRRPAVNDGHSPPGRWHPTSM